MEYETSSCTALADRECALLTECDLSTEYQVVAPTATSDRVCVNQTTCRFDGEQEYIAVLPTPTSDAACARVSECDVFEHEAASPTVTSDRVCTCVHPDGADTTVAVTVTLSDLDGSITNATAADIGAFLTDVTQALASATSLNLLSAIPLQQLQALVSGDVDKATTFDFPIPPELLAASAQGLVTVDNIAGFYSAHSCAYDVTDFGTPVEAAAAIRTGGAAATGPRPRLQGMAAVTVEEGTSLGTAVFVDVAVSMPTETHATVACLMHDGAARSDGTFLPTLQAASPYVTDATALTVSSVTVGDAAGACLCGCDDGGSNPSAVNRFSTTEMAIVAVLTVLVLVTVLALVVVLRLWRQKSRRVSELTRVPAAPDLPAYIAPPTYASVERVAMQKGGMGAGLSKGEASRRASLRDRIYERLSHSGRRPRPQFEWLAGGGASREGLQAPPYRPPPAYTPYEVDDVTTDGDDDYTSDADEYWGSMSDVSKRPTSEFGGSLYAEDGVLDMHMTGAASIASDWQRDGRMTPPPLPLPVRGVDSDVFDVPPYQAPPQYSDAWLYGGGSASSDRDPRGDSSFYGDGDADTIDDLESIDDDDGDGDYAKSADVTLESRMGHVPLYDGRINSGGDVLAEMPLPSRVAVKNTAPSTPTSTTPTGTPKRVHGGRLRRGHEADAQDDRGVRTGRTPRAWMSRSEPASIAGDSSAVGDDDDDDYGARGGAHGGARQPRVKAEARAGRDVIPLDDSNLDMSGDVAMAAGVWEEPAYWSGPSTRPPTPEYEEPPQFPSSLQGSFRGHLSDMHSDTDR